MSIKKSAWFHRCLSIFGLAGILVATSVWPASALPGDFSQPITVSTIQNFVPANSKNCIYVPGTNLLTVTSVKIDNEDELVANIVENYNNYFYICPPLDRFAIGKHTMKIASAITTTPIEKVYYAFGVPTLTSQPTPISGDKKGGTEVIATGNYLSSTATVGDKTVVYTPYLMFGGVSQTLTSTATQLKFRTLAVKQAQVVPFYLGVNVSMDGATTSWSFTVTNPNTTFTYTSGNSSTNYSSTGPTLTADVSLISKGNYCSVTLKASGLITTDYYVASAQAYFGPFSGSPSVTLGSSYPDKQGQLTLSNSTLIRSVWGKDSGATILVTLYNSNKTLSHTTVARNQC